MRTRGWGVAALLAAVLVAPMHAAEPAQAAVQTYYAAPNGATSSSGACSRTAPCSLTAVRDKVRGLAPAMTDDIVVTLLGGTYALQSTFVLDQRDSGLNGHQVIWRSETAYGAMLSGGRQVTGWTQHDAAKNIWKSVAYPGIETRQLYVNGTRATRARLGAGLAGATHDDVGHTTTNTAIAGWKNLRDVELVYRQIWTQPRNLIASASVTGATATLTMQQPAYGYNRRKGQTATTTPVDVENAYEVLDEAGEWYLDRSGSVDGSGQRRFYYKPRAGENLGQARVIAPVLEQLVDVRGTLDAPVRDIRFEGITFAEATWLQPSTFGGHPDIQGNLIRTREAGQALEVAPEILSPANVRIAAAEGIVFERCEFTRLGGAGLDILAGSRGNTVRGSRFHDISGSGIQVGEVDWSNGSLTYTPGTPYRTDNYNPSDTRRIITDNLISNNHITRVAVEYASGNGVWAGYTDGLDIVHNEISHLPYSGIAIGWGWGRAEPNVARNNTVDDNHVHHVMQLLKDGGAIYTLGSQEGTSIRRNHVHDLDNEFGAIYLDEGTTFVTVQSNVVESDPLRWLYIWRSTIRNNVVTGNWSDTSYFRNDGVDNTVASNTVVANGQWPAGADAVIGGAGVEAAYRDILLPPRTENIATGSTNGLDSGWSSVHRLWDEKADAEAFAAGSSTAWVQYDFPADMNIRELRFREDHDGTYQATDWKVQRWSISLNAWVDINAWTPSTTSAWQSFTPPAGMKTTNIRLHVRNTAGGVPAALEFECLGDRVTP